MVNVVVFSFSLQPSVFSSGVSVSARRAKNVVPKDDFTSRQGTFSAGGVFSAVSLRAERLRGVEDRPPLREEPILSIPDTVAGIPRCCS